MASTSIGRAAGSPGGLGRWTLDAVADIVVSGFPAADERQTRGLRRCERATAILPSRKDARADEWDGLESR